MRAYRGARKFSIYVYVYVCNGKVKVILPSPAYTK